MTSSCIVALVLLLDASGSINAADWRLQLDAHAAALEADSVVAVIERGEPVAVAAMGFSDAAQTILPWRLLQSRQDAAEAAAALRGAARPPGFGTALGPALWAAMGLLPSAPCRADQEVIDLVTDGEAHPPTDARAYAEAQGVRINALGVGPDTAVEWLREHAITQGGFAMQAAGWSEFGAAIRRKITWEISQAVR